MQNSKTSTILIIVAIIAALAVVEGGIFLIKNSKDNPVDTNMSLEAGNINIETNTEEHMNVIVDDISDPIIDNYIPLPPVDDFPIYDEPQLPIKENLDGTEDTDTSISSDEDIRNYFDPDVKEVFNYSEKTEEDKHEHHELKYDGKTVICCELVNRPFVDTENNISYLPITFWVGEQSN